MSQFTVSHDLDNFYDVGESNNCNCTLSGCESNKQQCPLGSKTITGTDLTNESNFKKCMKNCKHTFPSENSIKCHKRNKKHGDLKRTLCYDIPNKTTKSPYTPTTSPLVPTTSPYTPTTTPLVPTTSPYTPTTTPLVPTTTPLVPTTSPYAPTTTPLVPTTSPLVPTTTPLVPTTSPYAPTTSPLVPTTSPYAPTTSPLVPTTSPYAPTTTPLVPTTSPYAPTTSPLVPTTSPYAPTTSPLVPTTSPYAPTTSPLVPTTSPYAPTTTPLVPSGTTTKKPVPTDPAIKVELDKDLKKYIKMKIQEHKNKEIRDDDFLKSHIGISPDLFSSLTSGLAIEDLQY